MIPARTTMLSMRSVHWLGASLLIACAPIYANGPLSVLEQLAKSDPKPFAILEASGEGTENRGQAVVISSHGHVLSAGHIAWIEADKAFAEKFRISFRSSSEDRPEGATHTHKLEFKDNESATFFEHFFPADLKKQEDSRFIAAGDLALFKIKAEGPFPKLDFFSEERPTLEMGDTLHLCHYNFPHKAGDPFFLINPVEVVGVAETSWGMQYLAKGYYRIGSSGGAILKDGRLIGIQSSAYTVNAKDIGEIPLGLVSFQLVWSGMFDGQLGLETDYVEE